MKLIKCFQKNGSLALNNIEQLLIVILLGEE